MDKHDRPYKCKVEGCEKLQGFTSSGGFLRHKREVHKTDGGIQKALFCDFLNCKRSSGAGFTRRANLDEHIRRVHRISDDIHNVPIRHDIRPIAAKCLSEPTYSSNNKDGDDLPGAKRKSSSDLAFDESRDNMRLEIKRLRQENEEKDSQLRQLEKAVMTLQHQTP
jgi:hypothetical protein